MYRKKITGKVIIILIIILSCIFIATKPDTCGGKERWLVKTLTDSLASRVDLTAKPIDIKTLISYKKIGPVSSNLKRTGIEFNTYTIVCKITYCKLEEDDDYHLVLQDTASNITMIGEIPDPNCETVKNSVVIKQITSARNFFNNNKATILLGCYKVTGVAFFDKIHGQTGVAPNGIELHPITNIEKY